MKRRNKIITATILIFIVIASSAYAFTTFSSYKPRNYKITIYLDETKDHQTQVNNVTELIRNYYFDKNMVMSVVFGLEGNTSVLYNHATEEHLENIVTLLENNGYRVEYTEEISEKE